MKCRVSVCLASYNGENFIIKQVNSILDQLSSEDELIISDDGSTDNTHRIIESLNDSRIKICKNYSPVRKRFPKSNLYRITKNFENALNNSRGEYIFLSDQDDIWVKEKVDTTLKYLRNSDLVVSDYHLIDDNDNLLSKSTVKRYKNTNFFSNLLYTPYFGCGMAFKRQILEKALPFPSNLFAHDLWIGFIARFEGKVIFVDDKLIYHRRHGKNMSFSFEKSKNTFAFKIIYRIQFISQILSRYLLLMTKKLK